MTSIYNINSTNCFVPSGSVLAFIGSTTTDPPGWVIADGVARTTSDDYNNLVTLSIGSRDGNNKYVPPNLQGAFLRGTGTSNINNGYAGTNLLTQQSHALKTHLHTATQDPHSHGTNPASNGGNGTINNASYGLVKCAGQTHYPPYDVTENTVSRTGDYHVNIYNYAGLIIEEVTPAITVEQNTNNESNDTETIPFSYGVFWIIKL